MWRSFRVRSRAPRGSSFARFEALESLALAAFRPRRPEVKREVGVLLKQMQSGLGALSKASFEGSVAAAAREVTHIFIDEIHERSADCDLLLLLLRQVRSSRPDLRLVLMSVPRLVFKSTMRLRQPWRPRSWSDTSAVRALCRCSLSLVEPFRCLEKGLSGC